MKSSGISVVLVIAQFILIAMIASPVTNLISTRPAALLGTLLISSGVFIAMWALFSMRRGTFSVLPEPARRGQLTQTGPYRWIRHPMYFAVLLAAAGAVVGHATLSHALIFLALIIVLLLKIHREERYLLVTYDDYADYASRTRALVPLVY